MAVIYLFNAAKQPKRPIKRVQEIIHNENEFTATTEISMMEPVEYGDCFGFMCADKRFRLFTINLEEKNDEDGITTLTGYDAAVAELNAIVLENLPLMDTTAQKGITDALKGTAWTTGNVTGDGSVYLPNAYFETAWSAMRRIADAGKVRIIPYYEFEDGQITARKVDVTPREHAWRGMIYTRGTGARNIHITKEGMPYGRVYPIGKIIGSEDPPEQVTIAEAVWSQAKGDPADKPLGQKWVAIPGAKTDAEYVFVDKRETDPEKLLQKGFEDLQKRQKPKASGTANIGEMGLVPGYEHRIVRLWDMVVVRTEDGENVETTVIGIKRYYVHKELTKITLGEEDEPETESLEDLLSRMNLEIADNIRRAGGGAAGAGKAKQMVLEAEKLIQINSERIELNAEEIAMRAFEAEVVRMEEETLTKFKEVGLDISTQAARLYAAETTVDNLKNTVSQNTAELTVQAGQIATKVETNGVISAINQTAEEIKIQANKINLSGYVTASKFEAEMAVIDNIFAGYSEISALGINGNLYAKNANITDNLRLFEHYASWAEVTLYRGGKVSINSTTSLTVYDYKGNPIGKVNGIPSGFSFSPSSNGTINYLTY